MFLNRYELSRLLIRSFERRNFFMFIYLRGKWTRVERTQKLLAHNTKSMLAHNTKSIVIVVVSYESLVLALALPCIDQA